MDAESYRNASDAQCVKLQEARGKKVGHMDIIQKNAGNTVGQVEKTMRRLFKIYHALGL